MRQTAQQPAPDASARDAVTDAPAPGHVPDTPTLFAARYEVMSLLGEGGMGAVYRVRDLELDEEVALKVLHPSYAETPGALERFRREVKLARKVTHPNVARMYDFGSDAGRRFLTMELVEGESLTTRLGREGKLALSESLRIVGDVARGLAAAHAVGVVHRDLKPDNILLDTNAIAQRGSERVVVTDFGIAVVAEGATKGAHPTVSIIGTPEYMAPEQVEGRELDGRADVYALGVMLFEMLAERLPFDATSPYLIAAMRLTNDPPKLRVIEPSVPEPIAALVGEMLVRAREGRPDMLQVVDAIDALRGARKAVDPVRGRRATAPQITRALPTTVVIAPFTTSDAESAVAGVEIGESIGDALARESGLRVVPVVSIPGGAAFDARALGEERSASLVVHGSIRRSDDCVRLRARLLEVSTGVQLWGQKFDTPTSFAAIDSDAVSAAVLEAVQATRGQDQEPTVTPSSQRIDDGPKDPMARVLYEKGIDAARQFGDHIDRAIEFLREANRIAPNDPHILSALGAALVRLWSFSGNAAVLGEAEDWSLRALATGTRIGQTFNTIGILRLHQGELRAAVDAFREAATRSPRLAEPHSYLGRLLSESGHVEEATRKLERAVDLDPGDQHAFTELARIAAMNNDWDRASALLEKAATGRAEGIVRATKARFTVWRRDPRRLALAVADVEARRDDPGLRVVIPLLMPIWRGLANGETVALDDERLVSLQNAAAGTSMRLTMFWYQLLAELYGVCGHHDAALDAIEAASTRKLIDVLWLDRCPALADLRSNARLSRARAAVAARAAALWR